MPEKIIYKPKEISPEEILLKVKSKISQYRNVKGSLIPILQATQNDIGYLPKIALKLISEEIKIPYSEISGVVTFYSFFSTTQKGKYIIRVCLGTACYVRGGKAILEELKKQLCIDVGETSEDKLFSLESDRCFGACGLAPVVLVNEAVHQRVKVVKISEILDKYRQEAMLESRGKLK